MGVVKPEKAGILLIFLCLFATDFLLAAEDRSRLAQPQYQITLPQQPQQIQPRILIAPVAVIPNVIGKTEKQAIAIVERAGFKASISRKNVSRGRGNVVLSQTPAASKASKRGAIVSLVISKYVKPLSVSISPAGVVNVTRGKPVTFTANVNKSYYLYYSWSCSCGSKPGKNKKYTVNTNNLKPGRYTVKVTVSEPDIEQTGRAAKASASAILNIGEQYAKVPNLSGSYANAAKKMVGTGLRLGKPGYKTVSSGRDQWVIDQNPKPDTRAVIGSLVIPTVTKLKRPVLKIRIEPAILTGKTGEKASFRAIYAPRNALVTWRGPLQLQGRGANYSVPVDSLNPGKHTITATVRLPDSRITKSAQATLRVAACTVPKVMGDYLPVARKKLSAANLKSVVEKYRDVKRGKNNAVLEQSPVAGKQVKCNSVVNLVISKLFIPDPTLKIEQERVAVKQGQTAKFTAAFTPANATVKWSGPGNQSGSGATFHIATRSLQPGKIYPVKAQAIIPGAGKSDRDYAELEVRPNAPDVVTVPDLIGNARLAAMSKLQREPHLKAGKISYRTVRQGKDDVVLEQSPKPQSTVDAGSAVNLLISRLQIPALGLSIAKPVVEVDQGATVRFKGVSTNPLTSLDWQIPGAGIKSGKKEFLVHTANLQADDYTIKLNVKDTYGQTASATAMLHVKAPEAPVIVPEAIEPPEPEPAATEPEAEMEGILLILESEKQHFQVGDVSEYRIIASRKPPEAHYALHFARQGLISEWQDAAIIYRQLDEPGRYKINAIMDVDGQQYQSAPIEVWVWPQWTTAAFALLGLLGLAGGAVNAMIKPKTQIRLPKNTLTIEGYSDTGIQELIEMKVPDPDSRLDFDLSYGLPGEYRIEMEQQHQQHDTDA